LSGCLPQHLVTRNSTANLTGHFGWSYRRRVSAEIRWPSFIEVEYWQISSFATMRSSVRSRLAPPSFQALRTLPYSQSVPFCSNNHFRLAGKLPQVSSGPAFVRRHLSTLRTDAFVKPPRARVCRTRSARQEKQSPFRTG